MILTPVWRLDRSLREEPASLLAMVKLQLNYEFSENILNLRLFWYNTKRIEKERDLWQNTFNGTDNPSQEGFDILKGRGRLYRFAPPKLAISSWPVTRLVWNVTWSQPQQTRCGSFAEAWTNYVPLLNWILKLKPSTKNIGMKDILLGCILPWREDAYAKHCKLEMDVRNSWQMFVKSCFVIKFGSWWANR